MIANTCFDAIHKIGWPEGRIILSQTAVYLATSPKVTQPILQLIRQLKLLKKTGDLSVPLHLRNSPTKLMKQIGYGKDTSMRMSTTKILLNRNFYRKLYQEPSFITLGRILEKMKSVNG